MTFKTYTLKDLVEIKKDNIKPKDYPESSFEHYSLPSYDDYRTPEKSLGEDIKSVKYVLPNKSILFSKLNLRFKRVWRVENHQNNHFKVCSTEFLPLTIKNEEVIDFDFLFYKLISDEFINELEATATGTSGSHQRIKIDSFLNKEITIPDKNLQISMANILSTLDEKIEVNNQISKTLENMAQALFKQWFVDFDFPNENGEPYKSSGGEMVESEKGLIPKGWEVVQLDQISNITMGQSPKGTSYNENGEGVVFYQGRTDFNKRYPKRRLYTTEPKRIAAKGDILMSVRAPVGDINIAIEECCIGRGLAALNSKTEANSFLLYTMLKLRDEFEIYNGVGTVFGSINQKNLKSIKVIKPYNEVISLYENVVSSMDREYYSLVTESRRLEELRNTLLPKLMSGKIRVPLDEMEESVT